MSESLKKKILLVDDDSDFRASIAAVLEAEGYEVVHASSGREGLDRIAGEKPDLVVLDIMMEYDSAGYEVSQALKYRSDFAALKHIPILMVSSVQTDPSTLFWKGADAQMVEPDSYMTKPVDIPEFLEQVRSLLS